MWNEKPRLCGAGVYIVVFNDSKVCYPLLLRVGLLLPPPELLRPSEPELLEGAGLGRSIL